MRVQTLLSGLVVAAGLWAGNASAQELTVSDAWVRGTVPGQTATGVYMNLTSKSDAVLVGAASAVAGVVEVHEMRMDGDVMKMRAVPRLELPAGKTVRLDAAGNYHVMLMDLKRQLKKGETVTVTLKIEHPDKKVKAVKVKAPVRDLTDTGDPMAASDTMPHHDHHQ
jgi:copper(I)-binding protein